MKKIKDRFQELISIFCDPEYDFCFSDDLPVSIANGKIYIIGAHKHQWLLAFKCPCGCENIVQLNLLEHTFPKWGYKISLMGKLTIYPSINRMIGCRSHFFIIRGNVKWV